jgi:plastocyanin
MRRGAVVTLAVALGAISGGPAQAGFVNEVSITDNAFDPEVAGGLIGTGSVHWSRALGSVNPHNVSQDQGLFRSGDPTLGPIEFTVTPSAGRFDYQCEVHGPSMSGLVTGIMHFTRHSPELWITVIWATADTDTGRVFDVRYRVDGGDWQTWKTDTTRFKGAFGRNDRPVQVEPGHAYRFQGRSQVNDARNRDHSRWSQTLTYST